MSHSPPPQPALPTADSHPDPAPSPPPPAPASPAAAPSDSTPLEPATQGMDTSQLDAPAAEPAANGDAQDTPMADKPSARPAPEEDDETDEKREEKRRRTEKVKKESRARGNRMFGVMLGTLKRANAQVKTAGATDAGKKRAEIEEKLQEKLGKERREAIDKSAREREARELRVEIARREEEIAVAESIYRTRHNAKLDLAGFLCTTFSAPPPSTSTDGIPAPFLPKLPHAMALHGDPTRAPRPIYYLPRRLLPSQEDRIEDQIDAVKAALRRERAEWDEERGRKVDELDKARRRREERHEEIQRAEREERQRRRRAEEEREDREDQKMRERTGTREPSVVGMAVDRDGEDGAKARRSPSRSRSRSPARSRSRSRSRTRSPRRGDDDETMKEVAVAAVAAVGEEDLEY
ncbi:hypothetical protein JCM10207_006977 [Rhodosporidiobolus poonsookiae]